MITPELKARFPEVPIREGVLLSDYASFGIGGPAAGFVSVSDISLFARLLPGANALGVPTLIIGGGTNLLVSDAGYDGLVIHIDINDFQVDRELGIAKAGAGVPTALFVDRVIEAGMAGLEFAAGLPGTIGGAIAGNAGCFGHTLSDFLERVAILEPDGTVREVDVDWFDFDYRRSRVLDGEAVIVSATFNLQQGDRIALRAIAQQHLAIRSAKHPPKGAKTAGSYFKNLPPQAPGEPRRAAGALLDQAGVHGLRVGDAAVFERHANIIVNRGRATARDVLSLAAQMANQVRERFGVALEPEVRFIGEHPADIRYLIDTG
ncbi:MAG: UDP-N-acetylmuramate dehydrogenase [Myxococcota bacterium]|nr:UDP-N-acetylmuramate dehydrogenase [Myxococcota bacterium]